MTHQNDNNDDIKPLLIAGGSSIRMGTPKHLLPHKDGRPAYQHTLEHLIQALPHTRTFYISLRDESETQPLDLAGSRKIAKRVVPIYDPTNSNVMGPAIMGPAAGLVSAHVLSPTATWLVVGTDYPLLTPRTLRHLLANYVPPVTCFRASNGDGSTAPPDPRLAIWSPHPHRPRRENLAAGKCGPGMTVEELDGKILTPPPPSPSHDGGHGTRGATFGAHTPEDWEVAMRTARERERGREEIRPGGGAVTSRETRSVR